MSQELASTSEKINSSDWVNKVIGFQTLRELLDASTTFKEHFASKITYVLN